MKLFKLLLAALTMLIVTACGDGGGSNGGGGGLTPVDPTNPDTMYGSYNISHMTSGGLSVSTPQINGVVVLDYVDNKRYTKFQVQQPGVNNYAYSSEVIATASRPFGSEPTIDGNKLTITTNYGTITISKYSNHPDVPDDRPYNIVRTPVSSDMESSKTGTYSLGTVTMNNGDECKVINGEYAINFGGTKKYSYSMQLDCKTAGTVTEKETNKTLYDSPALGDCVTVLNSNEIFLTTAKGTYTLLKRYDAIKLFQ